MSIRLDRISKRFGTFAALHDVSLEARPGEFLALLGPSGSGKTTLLRIMAGLEFPDSGSVWFEGEDVTPLPVRERGVGFVFQHYALFRHMTIAENVAFGMRVRPRRERPPEAAVRARVSELLELVQLGDLGQRLPAQLSGGQRQRVALARALAVDPRLLLLDEPFGALDAKVRKDLRRWLRALHDRMGITSVFVTHDQEEALELADRVVVMDHGLIAQVASPAEIYERPCSPFVFDFVGESNRLPVTVAEGEVRLLGRAIKLDDTSVRDGPATLFFRPHDARLSDEGNGAVPFRIERVNRLGGVSRIEGRIDGIDKAVEIIADREPPPPGSLVHIMLDRASLYPDRGSTHRFP